MIAVFIAGSLASCGAKNRESGLNPTRLVSFVTTRTRTTLFAMTGGFGRANTEEELCRLDLVGGNRISIVGGVKVPLWPGRTERRARLVEGIER